MAKLPLHATLDIPELKQLQKDHKALVKRVEEMENTKLHYRDKDGEFITVKGMKGLLDG